MTVQEDAKKMFGNVDYFPEDKESFSLCLQSAYIAGANEHKDCLRCEMHFREMEREKPSDPGQYLVIRNRYGRKWYEILMWTGKFWVTGLHDDPDAMVEKWMKLRPL